MKFKFDDFPLQDSILLQQIIMLRERGMSIRAIAQELKISGNRVHSLLKKSGIYLLLLNKKQRDVSE